mgnify:CR=1 FL=1
MTSPSVGSHIAFVTLIFILSKTGLETLQKKSTLKSFNQNKNIKSLNKHLIFDKLFFMNCNNDKRRNILN